MLYNMLSRGKAQFHKMGQESSGTHCITKLTDGHSPSRTHSFTCTIYCLRISRCRKARAELACRSVSGCSNYTGIYGLNRVMQVLKSHRWSATHLLHFPPTSLPFTSRRDQTMFVSIGNHRQASSTRTLPT